MHFLFHNRICIQHIPFNNPNAANFITSGGVEYNVQCFVEYEAIWNLGSDVSVNPNSKIVLR